MKQTFIIIILLLASAFTFPEEDSEAKKEIREANRIYFNELAKARSDFRVQLARSLRHADRIEIYLLDFEIEDTDSNFYYWENRLGENEFPVLAYGAKTRILDRKNLTQEQIGELLPELKNVVGIEGNVGSGAMCHIPIHGVRVYEGKSLLFQSSFCWKCHNFAVSYPDGNAWVQIHGHELHEAFETLLPVPQEEIDRFNERFGPQKDENP